MLEMIPDYLKVIAIVIGLYLIYKYVACSCSIREGFEAIMAGDTNVSKVDGSTVASAAVVPVVAPVIPVVQSTSVPSAASATSNMSLQDISQQVASLLPSSTETDTVKTAQQLLEAQDLLIAGSSYGVMSGAVNKNPNLQLRSDPLIKKVDVGPWLQSDYLPDTMRRPFEIGA